MFLKKIEYKIVKKISGAAQYNAMQCGAIWYDALHCSGVYVNRCSVVHYGLVHANKCDMVWCKMI